jgi:hypothetical protein
MIIMKISTLTALCFVLVLTWDVSAYAYLDGASGSIIVQALIGGIVGIGVLAKMYWQGLLIKLGIRKPAEEEPEETDPATDAE